MMMMMMIYNLIMRFEVSAETKIWNASFLLRRHVVITVVTNVSEELIVFYPDDDDVKFIISVGNRTKVYTTPYKDVHNPKLFN
jgi:hypothetical protein